MAPSGLFLGFLRLSDPFPSLFFRKMRFFPKKDLIFCLFGFENSANRM